MLSEKFRQMLLSAIETGRVKNATHLAEVSGVDQGALSKFLKGTSKGLHLDTIGRILDALGGEITIPNGAADPSREVCFVDMKTVAAGEGLPPPDSEDYFAVPLVDEVGAGAGYIPQGELRSWLLVWRWQKSVSQRRNLIAVELAKDADSMQPTLYPGDIVLIDRDEKRVVHNGKMWLVRDPMDDSAMIKRVALTDNPDKKDVKITYYSDNSDYAPESFSLSSDFLGDMNRAIVGRVVWAWSDVSNK